jgi:hypothetical protein
MNRSTCNLRYYLLSKAGEENTFRQIITIIIKIIIGFGYEIWFIITSTKCCFPKKIHLSWIFSRYLDNRNKSGYKTWHETVWIYKISGKMLRKIPSIEKNLRKCYSLSYQPVVQKCHSRWHCESICFLGYRLKQRIVPSNRASPIPSSVSPHFRTLCLFWWSVDYSSVRNQTESMYQCSAKNDRQTDSQTASGMRRYSNSYLARCNCVKEPEATVWRRQKQLCKGARAIVMKEPGASVLGSQEQLCELKKGARSSCVKEPGATVWSSQEQLCEGARSSCVKELGATVWRSQEQLCEGARSNCVK